MVTSRRRYPTRYPTRYHQKASNRKGKTASGNEVTRFLYRLLKKYPTHTKTGTREGTYAYYRTFSGSLVTTGEHMERERDIEKWLRQKIEQMGGIALKFTSPGNDGVPDRIAILPGGQVWFIELKTTGEKPRAIQEWQIERLRKLGCNVALIAGVEEARAWIWEVIG